LPGYVHFDNQEGEGNYFRTVGPEDPESQYSDDPANDTEIKEVAGIMLLTGKDHFFISHEGTDFHAKHNGRLDAFGGPMTGELHLFAQNSVDTNDPQLHMTGQEYLVQFHNCKEYEKQEMAIVNYKPNLWSSEYNPTQEEKHKLFEDSQYGEFEWDLLTSIKTCGANREDLSTAIDLEGVAKTMRPLLNVVSCIRFQRDPRSIGANEVRRIQKPEFWFENKSILDRLSSDRIATNWKGPFALVAWPVLAALGLCGDVTTSEKCLSLVKSGYNANGPTNGNGDEREEVAAVALGRTLIKFLLGPTSAALVRGIIAAELYPAYDALVEQLRLMLSVATKMADDKKALLAVTGEGAKVPTFKDVTTTWMAEVAGLSVDMQSIAIGPGFDTKTDALAMAKEVDPRYMSACNEAAIQSLSLRSLDHETVGGYYKVVVVVQIQDNSGPSGRVHGSAPNAYALNARTPSAREFPKLGAPRDIMAGDQKLKEGEASAPSSSSYVIHSVDHTASDNNLGQGTAADSSSLQGVIPSSRWSEVWGGSITTAHHGSPSQRVEVQPMSKPPPADLGANTYGLGGKAKEIFDGTDETCDQAFEQHVKESGERWATDTHENAAQPGKHRANHGIMHQNGTRAYLHDHLAMGLASGLPLPPSIQKASVHVVEEQKPSMGKEPWITPATPVGVLPGRHLPTGIKQFIRIVEMPNKTVKRLYGRPQEHRLGAILGVSLASTPGSDKATATMCIDGSDARLGDSISAECSSDQYIESIVERAALAKAAFNRVESWVNAAKQAGGAKMNVTSHVIEVYVDVSSKMWQEAVAAIAISSLVTNDECSRATNKGSEVARIRATGIALRWIMIQSHIRGCDAMPAYPELFLRITNSQTTHAPLPHMTMDGSETRRYFSTAESPEQIYGPRKAQAGDHEVTRLTLAKRVILNTVTPTAGVGTDWENQVAHWNTMGSRFVMGTTNNTVGRWNKYCFLNGVTLNQGAVLPQGYDNQGRRFGKNSPQWASNGESLMSLEDESTTAAVTYPPTDGSSSDEDRKRARSQTPERPRLTIPDMNGAGAGTKVPRTESACHEPNRHQLTPYKARASAPSRNSGPTTGWNRAPPPPPYSTNS
jgi:hypothetical protein